MIYFWKTAASRYTRSSSLFTLLALSIASSALIAVGAGGVGIANAAYPAVAVGNVPAGIAFDPSNGGLYVTNFNDKTVSVISSQTNTVVGSPIAVGTQPVSVAFDSLNGNLYVANQGSNNVLVISGKTNTVVGSPIPVGSGPQTIAFDSLNGNLYVANCFSNTVSVISGQKNVVVGSPIPVGSCPSGVAFDPSNGDLYVTNLFSNTVSVISSQTNKVVGSPISVGSAPSGVAFDSANGDLYVANSANGCDACEGTVSVISGQTNTVIGSPIAVGHNPIGVAFDSANGFVYVANRASNTISVISGQTISGQTNVVVGSPIPVGIGPDEVASVPNGNLYVTNENDNTVSVISGQTNIVIGSPITVGSIPAGIAFDSANGNLYVANGAGSVSVISGKTNTVVGSPIPVGQTPVGIAFDSANGNLYVANTGTNTVSVISGQTNAVVGNPIPVGPQPYRIEFDSANGNLYVTDKGSTTVSVISGQTNTVIGKPIPVGSSPVDVAFDSANGNLYVTNGGGNTVSVISGQTNTVIATIPVGSGPFAIAFDSANGNLYVTNANDNTVSVISGQFNKASPIGGVGNQPEGIAFDSTNGNLYVANTGGVFNPGNTVSVISGQTNTVVGDQIHVGNNPVDVAFDTANGNVYVTNDGSNTVSVIATTLHPTTLTLNAIASVPWGKPVTITGKLTDTTTGSPISGATITFSGTGAANLPKAVTASNGVFSTSGKTPNTVATGWTVQAQYGGGGIDESSNSATATYNTIKHTTVLTLSVPLNIPLGTTATVSGKLTDSSAGGVGVASKTISFTSLNVRPLPASVLTKSDGTYSSTFTASNTIFTGWQLQAQFAGGSLYTAAASNVASYNTVKDTTGLTLVISPRAVKPGATYSVSGILTDTTKSVGLASKTITFTATSPITISSGTTNSLGQYGATGLIAPSTPGTYIIQSHYAGESLYNAANSPTQTLTVSTTAAAAPSTTGQITSPTAGAAKVPATGSATRSSAGPIMTLLAPHLQLQQPQQQLGQQLGQRTPQQLSLPIANAGVSKTVLENTVVTLDGTASYSPSIGGKVIAYQWTQLPMGVPVLLSGASTATPTFTAPVVPSDIVLSFSLRVMDNHEAVSTNPAIVYVMVKHNPNIGPTTSPNANQPQEQQHPLQSIVPNSLQPIPSQPNSHQLQIGSVRP